MSTNMKSILSVMSLAPLSAFAHPGHGLEGVAHWHATDVLGLVIVLALAAGAFWRGRGK
jgi:hypothetical protein